MISRYRLRRLIAPSVAFRKSAGIALIGLIAVFLGTALSFQVVLLPLLKRIHENTLETMGQLFGAGPSETATHMLGGALLFFGSYLVFKGARASVLQIVSTLTGQREGTVDVYVRRQALARGPRVVAIGGGTGLSTLLRGLKQHSSNITAIVTVTDDGGSSGKLVREKAMIPPGDIRNCLVALADAEKSMTDLFQHRFKEDSGNLSGHSIGNLLIAALTDQSHGDFEKAIEKASEVLLIRGRVVPSTLQHVGLRAEMEDGTTLHGETTIAQTSKRIRRIHLEPGKPEAHQGAVEAILNADLIVIGPGSVYTSVIPNLLVPGIAAALQQAEAMRVYVCNVMTQPGESDSFSASEHLTAILANVDGKLIDAVLVNTGVPSPGAIEKYKDSGQFLVDPDVDRIRAKGLKVFSADFMSESDFVRHDPMKLAARLMMLVGK